MSRFFIAARALSCLCLASTSTALQSKICFPEAPLRGSGAVGGRLHGVGGRLRMGATALARAGQDVGKRNWLDPCVNEARSEPGQPRSFGLSCETPPSGALLRRRRRRRRRVGASEDHGFEEPSLVRVWVFHELVCLWACRFECGSTGM